MMHIDAAEKSTARGSLAIPNMHNFAWRSKSAGQQLSTASSNDIATAESEMIEGVLHSERKLAIA